MTEILGGGPSMEERLILEHLKGRYEDLNKYLRKKTKLLEKFYIDQDSIKELLLFFQKKDNNKIANKKTSKGKQLSPYLKDTITDDYLNLTDKKWYLYMITIL